MKEVTMQLKHISLANLGRFRTLDLSFAPFKEFDSNVTVLIGSNGGGKTTVLKALAISLSWLVARIRSDKGSGSPIPEDAILNGALSSAITLNLEQQGEFKWTVTKTRPGRKAEHSSQLNAVSILADVYRSRLSSEEKTNLPLLAFYPVGRSVLDIPLEIKGRRQFSQLDGYENALNQGVDFRRFFEWFRNREDLENETVSDLLGRDPETVFRLLDLINNAPERLDKLKAFDWPGLSRELKTVTQALKLTSEVDREIKDRQLNAVRSAIANFMPGFSNLMVQRKPRLFMSVDKNGETLDVAQLSWGEKSLMALAGDIARRLAMLNPGLENPLQGEGVVLIDEIDMHLHPQWARTIIERLTRTFPHCQFVLSTHSPLVISDYKDVLVYALDEEEPDPLPSQYGQDANTVLLDVMHADIRNASVDQRLNDLLDLIQDRKLDAAGDLLAKLELELPKDNLELTKAKYLLRKETLRRAPD
jgi:predicted ATP-binding protein involved in virulence